MKRARAWSARVALVGFSLTWIGCGGSDVPDPASDSAASTDAAPPAVAGAEPKADAPAEAVAAVPAPAAAPAPDAETFEADPPAEAAPAAAVAAKGDASGTTELLNLANAAPPPVAEATEEAPAPGASGPGGMAAMMKPGGTGGYPGAGGNIPGPASMPAFPMPANAGISGYPGAGGNSSAMPAPGGYPGGPGGSGPGGSNKPPDFRQPVSAANAFLAAVKAKDRDLLAEATALRAPTEASTESMKKLFLTVLDQSISDETLAEIDKTLTGFKIVDANTPKSTGRYGVILGKTNGKGGQFRRTITLRKEAKGWKVVDISGQAEMESMMPNYRNTRTPARKK